METLIEELEDEDRDLKELCIALSAFGADAKSAVPILIKIIDEVYCSKRSFIESALGKIAGPNSPQLLAALGHDKPVVRVTAVRVLGKFPESLPRITQAMRDPSARVRLATVEAISRLKDANRLNDIPHVERDSIIMGLQKLSRDDEMRVIREAARRVERQLSN